MRNSLGKDRKSIEMIKETPIGAGSDKHKRKFSNDDTGLSGGFRLVDSNDDMKDKNNGGCGCY